jgi:hypothetical protein
MSPAVWASGPDPGVVRFPEEPINIRHAAIVPTNRVNGRAPGRSANQSGAGVRNRWIHGRRQHIRCSDLRLLRGVAAALRRANAERIYTATARRTHEELSPPGDSRLSVREFARSEKRPMGTRSHRGQDEGLPVATPRARGAIRSPAARAARPQRYT